MTVFVDTSALYAVLDRNDKYHPVAAATWRRLIGDRDVFVTTNYVLVETTALVQSRLGFEAARVFQQDIVPLLEVHWVTEFDHRAAVQAMLVAGRRKLSLVDCVSFEAVRARAADAVFAFDEHFVEQGFRVL